MANVNRSRAALLFRIGDHEQTVASRAWLEARLQEVRRGGVRDFSIIERISDDSRLTRLVYKALGLRADVEGRGVHVLTDGNSAAVTFTDDAQSEYRVRRKEPVHGSPELVEFRLSNGQRVAVRPDELISIDDAERAVLHFHDARTRPRWLSYSHEP